jgi:nucleotide-binding universal stress UspA family protein
VKRLEPGAELDGFKIDELSHAGGMAHIYRVSGGNVGFPLMMKVPRMSQGDGSETLVSYEVERTVLSTLSGPHVPRLVATGDLANRPYLVMEAIEGRCLSEWLKVPRPGAEEVARLGAALATAVHSLHRQDVIHLDIKPGNVIIRPNGTAVLVDFGLSHHAKYPDLLAEGLRRAVGSAPYISPEQVIGVRNDPRSDIFSIGVTLYELATGELPFGAPSGNSGLRRRLWAAPVPPRAHEASIPEWLQEVILHCLEPDPEKRYATARQLAFELSNPSRVPITDRGRRTERLGMMARIKAWLKASGRERKDATVVPSQQTSEAAIVLAAVAIRQAADAVDVALRKEVERVLAQEPDSRLTCVTVIPPTPLMTGGKDELSETSIHRQHMVQLQAWAEPLQLSAQRVSFHVIESGDPARALLTFAQGNHVSLIVIGAPTQSPTLLNPRASVAARVAAEAPCSVHLIRAALPFVHLAGLAETDQDEGTPLR